MKTRTLTISILLLAVVLVPLAMAAPKDRPLGQDGPRGPRGDRGGQWQGSGGPGGGFQGGPRMGGMGHPGLGQLLLGRAGEKLELTDEQKDQIKAIVDDCQADSEETRTAVQNAMKALHEAAADGTEAEIIAAGKALGDAFTNQALKRAATMKAVKGVLTEEQLVKLEELKAEMKERMQQRLEKAPDCPVDAPRPRRGQGDGQGRRGGRRGPAPEQE